jgi:hypothetical protein
MSDERFTLGNLLDPDMCDRLKKAVADGSINGIVNDFLEDMEEKGKRLSDHKPGSEPYLSDRLDKGKDIYHALQYFLDEHEENKAEKADMIELKARSRKNAEKHLKKEHEEERSG